MIDFAAPLAFLLLPLPLLVRRFSGSSRRRLASLAVPGVLVAAAEPEGRLGRLMEARGRILAVLAAWVFLVLALAGPRVLTPQQALPISGRDVVLVLDVSGSMERKDYALGDKRVRRIDAVKVVADDFLARRGGDRVGLVAFSEKPYLASLPTFDLASVRAVLADLDVGMLGRSTAIGDGLGLALKALEPSTSPSKVAILLSDGTSTAGKVGAEAAAALAKTLGVVVHTIALGSGDLDAYREIVDIEALAAIAEVAGGESFEVHTTADLEAVSEALDALEPVRMEGAAVSVHRDLWIWPAGAALLIAAAGALMSWRRG